MTATAVAQTPTEDAYSGVAGQQTGQGAAGEAAGDGAGAPAAAVSAAGDSDDDLGVLPFTGQQLLIIGIAGSLLIASGLILRRSARRTE